MITRKLLGGSDLRFPTRSLLFAGASNQRLKMLWADFGTINNKKLGISLWVKQATVSTMIVDSGGSEAGSQHRFQVSLSNAGVDLVWALSLGTPGTGYSDYSISAEGALSVGTWAHLEFIVDTTQTTSSNRLQMWKNGTRLTVTAAAGYPGLNYNMPDPTTGQHLFLGRGESAGSFDGRIYQPCFFTPTIPAASELVTSNKPKDVRNITGLFSLLQTDEFSSLEDDYIKSTNWTNVNGVTKSTQTPLNS